MVFATSLNHLHSTLQVIVYSNSEKNNLTNLLSKMETILVLMSMAFFIGLYVLEKKGNEERVKIKNKIAEDEIESLKSELHIERSRSMMLEDNMKFEIRIIPKLEEHYEIEKIIDRPKKNLILDDELTVKMNANSYGIDDIIYEIKTNRGNIRYSIGLGYLSIDTDYIPKGVYPFGHDSDVYGFTLITTWIREHLLEDKENWTHIPYNIS